MSERILFYSRKQDYGWLSNFERAPMLIYGQMYSTNEHWYQSRKVATVDADMARWVAEAPNPYLAMVAGRAAFDRYADEDQKREWELTKDNIMLTGLRAKFGLNPTLKAKLLATDNATLHEDSPTDMYWGVKGEDKLGKLLMQVRDELRKEGP